jgi:hypothetical protein
MKKIVVKFWLINVLMSTIIFAVYRIVISLTKTMEGNSFEKWMQIVELVLNIGFSFAYLIAMIVSSFTVLLNLFTKIRNNFYLSLLTFLGIPSFFVVYILISGLIDLNNYNDSILTKLAFFSIAYLILMIITFLLFRKKVQNAQIE